MPGFRTTSALGWLVAGLAAGCGMTSPPDEATPGANGRGEFFRWDPIHDPADQVLEALAAGADAFVGHSSGGCVESLRPEVASSNCGLLHGAAPGWTFLAVFGREVFGDRGGLIDWIPIEVVVPTRFVLYSEAGDPIRSGTIVVADFRSPFRAVLELQADERPLMGRAVWSAAIEPAGALRVEGYGRYLRIDCLWTGIARMAIREAITGTAQVVRVFCANPLPDDGGGP
ncbi:MAG: hypothetical protein GYA57_04550 [Myxococcales bacterium]|nr:hypothetical protein [Myxococcales bacterium]